MYSSRLHILHLFFILPEYDNVLNDCNFHLYLRASAPELGPGSIVVKALRY